MKNLKINFIQLAETSDEQFNYGINFPFEDVSKDKLKEYSIKELFRFYTLQRKINAKAIKSNLPLHITFDLDGTILSTLNTKVHRSFSAKLKLQYTNKGFHRFALVFSEIFDFVTSDVVTLQGFEAFLNELNEKALFDESISKLEKSLTLSDKIVRGFESL